MEEIRHCKDHEHFVVLAETVNRTSEDVKVIKESLLGTLKEEGFVSKLRNLESKVEDLQSVKKAAVNVTITAWVEFVLLLIGSIIALILK